MSYNHPHVRYLPPPRNTATIKINKPINLGKIVIVLRVFGAASLGLLPLPAYAQGAISTVSGNGTSGFSGDGGSATSAQLNLGFVLFIGNSSTNYRYYSSGPYGVAVDSAGNLYITDHANHCIRKVTPAGVISTVAGTGGVKGFGGDGGSATYALLYYPNAVAVDSVGNLYISDFGNHRIRKVTPAGVISTVADSGSGGFSGDGGRATSAQLLYPGGVAVDSVGNLYIGDTGNDRIRKVTPGGVISTVAGNGGEDFSGDGGRATSAQLSFPSGVTVDSAGNLYIADWGLNCILNVTPAGVINTVAGNTNQGFSGDGGSATSAQLSWPSGVAVDSVGNLYIVDSKNNRIRKVTPLAKPAITGVVNGASFAAGAPISTGSWVAIFGTGLAPAGDSRKWNEATEIVNGNLPTNLDGTSVTVNGKPAAVEYIQPSQVNIQPPDDTALGPVQVVVNTAAGATDAFMVNYATFAPGLFPAAAPYIVAQHADNSYVTSAAPAKPGEVIILWGTGFGPANPAIPAGQVFSGANRLANAVTVTIGGQPAAVDFAGVVGAGLVQINVHVPFSIGNGDAGVVASVGGVSTQTTANMIPIHN